MYVSRRASKVDLRGGLAYIYICIYIEVNLGWVQTNPLVFWYQWDYLLTSFRKNAGYLRLAMDIREKSGKISMGHIWEGRRDSRQVWLGTTRSRSRRKPK